MPEPLVTTTLSYADDFLGDHGAASVAEELHTNSTVTSLNLRGNNIHGTGVSAIAEMLTKNKSIQSLSLDWNSIGSSAEGCEKLAQSVANSRSLTCLDLRNNRVGGVSAKALLPILQSSLNMKGSLTTLDLRWNELDDVAVKEIAAALEIDPGIEKLQEKDSKQLSILLEGNFCSSSSVSRLSKFCDIKVNDTTNISTQSIAAEKEDFIEKVYSPRKRSSSQGSEILRVSPSLLELSRIDSDLIVGNHNSSFESSVHENESIYSSINILTQNFGKPSQAIESTSHIPINSNSVSNNRKAMVHKMNKNNLVNDDKKNVTSTHIASLASNQKKKLGQLRPHTKTYTSNEKKKRIHQNDIGRRRNTKPIHKPRGVSDHINRMRRRQNFEKDSKNSHSHSKHTTKTSKTVTRPPQYPQKKTSKKRNERSKNERSKNKVHYNYKNGSHNSSLEPSAFPIETQKIINSLQIAERQKQSMIDHLQNTLEEQQQQIQEDRRLYDTIKNESNQMINSLQIAERQKQSMIDHLQNTLEEQYKQITIAEAKVKEKVIKNAALQQKLDAMKLQLSDQSEDSSRLHNMIMEIKNSSKKQQSVMESKIKQLEKQIYSEINETLVEEGPIPAEPILTSPLANAAKVEVEMEELSLGLSEKNYNDTVHNTNWEKEKWKARKIEQLCIVANAVLDNDDTSILHSVMKTLDNDKNIGIKKRKRRKKKVQSRSFINDKKSHRQDYDGTKNHSSSFSHSSQKDKNKSGISAIQNTKIIHRSLKQTTKPKKKQGKQKSGADEYERNRPPILDVADEYERNRPPISDLWKLQQSLDDKIEERSFEANIHKRILAVDNNFDDTNASFLRLGDDFKESGQSNSWVNGGPIEINEFDNVDGIGCNKARWLVSEDRHQNGYKSYYKNGHKSHYQNGERKKKVHPHRKTKSRSEHKIIKSTPKRPIWSSSKKSMKNKEISVLRTHSKSKRNTQQEEQALITRLHSTETECSKSRLKERNVGHARDPATRSASAARIRRQNEIPPRCPILTTSIRATIREAAKEVEDTHNNIHQSSDVLEKLTDGAVEVLKNGDYLGTEFGTKEGSKAYNSFVQNLRIQSMSPPKHCREMGTHIIPTEQAWKNGLRADSIGEKYTPQKNTIYDHHGHSHKGHHLAPTRVMLERQGKSRFEYSLRRDDTGDS